MIEIEAGSVGQRKGEETRSSEEYLCGVVKLGRRDAGSDGGVILWREKCCWCGLTVCVFSIGIIKLAICFPLF